MIDLLQNLANFLHRQLFKASNAPNAKAVSKIPYVCQIVKQHDTTHKEDNPRTHGNRAVKTIDIYNKG